MCSRMSTLSGGTLTNLWNELLKAEAPPFAIQVRIGMRVGMRVDMGMDMGVGHSLLQLHPHTAGVQLFIPVGV